MQLSAIASLTGEYISFESMNYVISDNLTKNLKVMLEVNSLENSYGKSLQLLTHS